MDQGFDRDAHAALAGRDYVLPDDVQALVAPVWGHRLILTGEAVHARRGPDEILHGVMNRVRIPAPGF